MSDESTATAVAAAEQTEASAGASSPAMDQGAYEIIRRRLLDHGQNLHTRLDALNADRRSAFGAIDFSILATERVTTVNNCEPRDMTGLGDRMLFGYNVQLGLRSETKVEDVFAVYSYADRKLREESLDLIRDPRFETDFRDLYRYYKQTRFAKFSRIGAHLFMVFRVGDGPDDIKTFKWAIQGDRLVYVDNRSEHEYRFPPQHEFEWTRTTREMHRQGLHPHVSIQDRIFVETVGGDLTIKIEDNTASGEGIYAEPVEDADQTLDDAEIHYALVGNLILLRIRPYKETSWRYIVYSEKVRKAVRIDDIASACLLLPEDQGLIFARGYYLQTGEYKTFDSVGPGMLFEKRIVSPNGEDTLFVFHNRESGSYVLLSYDLIEQAVSTPILCHGYTSFDNGETLVFRHTGTPQKSHQIQVWQTPYTGPDYVPPVEGESALAAIGNRDIVRCMAACRGVLSLLRKDDSYAGLYVDITKACTDILDAYFWLDRDEAHDLKSPLEGLRSAARSAIEEHEKVVRLRDRARQAVQHAESRLEAVQTSIRNRRFEAVGEYVAALAELRSLRGELIGLREVRYVDLDAIGVMEAAVEDSTKSTAGRCAEFLQSEDALAPFDARVGELSARINGLQTVAEARDLGEQMEACAGELEMLIDVVGNLDIDDATRRTAIIDAISNVYAGLNAARSRRKGRQQDLSRSEGSAEFASQMKLLGQAVVNYLDVCDTPDRCEENLAKLAMQLEELEGRFADFDDYLEQLTEKRTEIHEAFESRKLALTEARNKRAESLLRSGERVLKGIGTRAGALETVEAVNGFFAADMMVEKVRSVVKQLEELDDTVKAEDLRSRLKSMQQDAVRQLKDRLELFADGQNVIRLGERRFAVNTQTFDLTLVQRDGVMCLHLTGTDFFEPVADEDLLKTRAVWDMDLPSETPQVYRGEYLAHLLVRDLSAPDATPDVAAFLAMDDAERVALVQQRMAPRYDEGYVRGVHDRDGARILTALLEMERDAGLLRYSSKARALGRLWWDSLQEAALKKRIAARLRGLSACSEAFPGRPPQAQMLSELAVALSTFAKDIGITESAAADSALYLYKWIPAETVHPLSPAAGRLLQSFCEQLRSSAVLDSLTATLADLRDDHPASLALLREWIVAHARSLSITDDHGMVDEVAIHLLLEGAAPVDPARLAGTDLSRTLDGMIGDHPRILNGRLTVDYHDVLHRLREHESVAVPAFLRCREAKRKLLEVARESMRLEEFRPRVLTSFVRNRLIDRVYLPLIGDNLAKQLGEAGERKRTDRSGLLLLISPPGYGKTTLMEYVANRLGLVFMKINGPSLGHGVTSLDPAEAPNAGARQEVEKVNLALEMGDNVMIYLDDIQHCNPEFLQKFISLCDAQRRIEGVYKGRTRTYDLRGKKVCVVMAGNPYTESGAAFRIPDMLANRADTYNLGDIIGGSREDFELSYLENALTSNPVLQPLATRSREDIYALVRLAESENRESVELEGGYTAEEISEYAGVFRKLLRVRDVVLRVNQQYIASAAQADEFRTEPPFKLQGSYRNMNRLATKVLPVMNDEEVEALLLDHYQNEAQTLTTGAEANLLKFREMTGRLAPDDAQRWAEIKKTFGRNQLLRGAGSDDRTAQVLAQLASLGDGLGGIRDALAGGLEQVQASRAAAQSSEPARVVATLDRDVSAALAALVKAMEESASQRQDSAVVQTRLTDDTIAALSKLLPGASGVAAPAGVRSVVVAESGQAGATTPRIEVVNKVPQGMVHILRQQFKLIETWLQPLLEQSQAHAGQLDDLRQRLEGVSLSYQTLIDQIEKGNRRRHSERGGE